MSLCLVIIVTYTNDGQKFLSDCENSILETFKKRFTTTRKVIDRLSGLYSVDEILESLDNLKEKGLID